MPRYVKSRKGEMQRKTFKGFDSLAHMTQFLSRCDKKSWKTYQKLAKDYLTGKKTPPRQLRKSVLRKIIRNSSQRIVGVVESEFRHHHTHPKNSKLGGGIGEAVSTISHEVANLLGVPYLMDLIGKGPDRKPLSEKQKGFAEAVENTYKPVGERKDKVGTMTRLPEFDSDRISVWQQENGEKFIAVHGTKPNLHDIGHDVKIMGGKESTTDPEVEALMDKLDAVGEDYDIGGHSLATSYIYNALPEHGSHIDEIFLFNPASSPLQGVDYLKKHANEDQRITFFVNEGDMVSSGLYQQMDQDTLDNRVHIGDYRWSPLAAHSLTQWYEEGEEEGESEEPEPKHTSAEDMAKIEEYGRRAQAYVPHEYTMPAEERLQMQESTEPVDTRIAVI